MLDDFADKDFRDAFVEENIKTGLALQIRALREKAKMSQPVLAKVAGKTQSVISRLEDPNYGKFTLRTLIDLARAFDVALLVKFVSFSKLAAELKDLSPNALAVKTYVEEVKSVEQFVATSQAKIAALPPKDANKPLQRGALAARLPRDPLEDRSTIDPLPRLPSDSEDRLANDLYKRPSRDRYALEHTL